MCEWIEAACRPTHCLSDCLYNCLSVRGHSVHPMFPFSPNLDEWMLSFYLQQSLKLNIPPHENTWITSEFPFCVFSQTELEQRGNLVWATPDPHKICEHEITVSPLRVQLFKNPLVGPQTNCNRIHLEPDQDSSSSGLSLVVWSGPEVKTQRTSGGSVQKPPRVRL